MNAHTIKVGLLATVALGFGALGCARDEEEEGATESVTSALQASQHGGLTQDMAEVDEQSAVDPSRAAEFVANRKPVGVQPEGCMTRTRTGDTVHIVFNGCTGPFGKVRLDGSADVTFSHDDQGRLVANIVGGSDLEANDRPFSYKAKGTLAKLGDTRNITWHADASGETKRGRKYSRTTDVTVSVDTAKRCLKADGTASGTMAGFELDLSIEGLAVCEHACPTSGVAKAKLTGPRGKERSMSVSFDGSNQAHVVTPRGKEIDITMACEDGESEE